MGYNGSDMQVNHGFRQIKHECHSSAYGINVIDETIIYRTRLLTIYFDIFPNIFLSTK